MRTERTDKAPRVVVRRPGGSYNKTEFFSILRISYSHGCELIKAHPEFFEVFYVGP